ncbi:MAG: VWA domain-containing protein, partial [Rhodospirillaceae bacterium]
MASGKNLSGGKSVPQDLAGDVDRFLQQVASAPLPAVLEDPEPAGRLIFSLDATGSRQATWDLAVSIQAEMFKEADAVGGLDVQLVYYRGIMDYKFSPWERRAEALAKRMMAVRCQPGRTQIGRILSHAIRESRQNKVNAVVFVGDCCEE